MRIKQVYNAEGFIWYDVRALVRTTREDTVEFEMRFLCLPEDFDEIVEETCIEEFEDDFIEVLKVELLVKGRDYD